MVKKKHYKIILLIVVLFLVAAWLHSRLGFYFWGVTGFAEGNDDAFISYRYALNWVESGVLSFNLDDQPYVEGYSNPAYVLLAAAVIQLFGVESLHNIMAVIGVFSGAVAIVLIAVHFSKSISPGVGLGAAFVTALCPSLWIHSGSGLETGIVFMLQVLLWLTCSKFEFGDNKISHENYVLHLVILTLFLVFFRTDGFVFPAICAVYLLIKGFYRPAVYVVAAAVLAYVSVTVARLIYYGEWVPNTVNVKMGGEFLSRIVFALKILGSIAYKNGLIIGLIGVFWCGLSLLRSISLCRDASFLVLKRVVIDKSREVPVEFWLCSGLIAYYLLIGGDIYRERFLVVLFPMSAILVFKLLMVTKVSPTRVSLIIILFYGVSFVADPRLAWTDKRFDTFAETGHFLRENYPGAVLAVDAAGKIPFYSRLKTIDMLGLNNLAIAKSEHKGNIPGHSKYDVEYVLSLQPDIISSHVFGKGDLTYGLTRNIYQAAGYKLAWLVWSGGSLNDQQPFLRAEKMDEKAVEKAIKAGYGYAILERISERR